MEKVDDGTLRWTAFIVTSETGKSTHDPRPHGLNDVGEVSPNVDSAIEPDVASDSLNSRAMQQRGMTRRIVEGTFLYGIGQSLPQVVRVILMVTVFTRILTPADYGVIELANRFAAFVMTFMRLGVPGAVTRFYFDFTEGEPLRNYVTTVGWFLLWCSLAVGGVALAVWPWVSAHWLPGLPLFPWAFLAVVGGIVYVNMELQNRLVQAREQAGYQARLTIVAPAVSIVLALLFVVVLRQGPLGMYAAEVASFGGLGLIAVWYLRPELQGRFKRPMLRSSLVYGSAQIPGDIVNSLTPLVTQGFLANVGSTAATGVLSVAVKFTQPLTILTNAFQTAYNPIYFSVRKEATPESLDRLATTARSVWMVAVFCALGTALLGPSVILLVLPKSYHAGAAVVPILVIAFLGQAASTVFGPEIYYSKKTWLVPIVVYTSAFVDVIVSILTAKRYGAIGVAWGMSARMVTTALLAGIFSSWLVTIPHAWFSYLSDRRLWGHGRFRHDLATDGIAVGRIGMGNLRLGNVPAAAASQRRSDSPRSRGSAQESGAAISSMTANRHRNSVPRD